LILKALLVSCREELARSDGTVFSAIRRVINGVRILFFPRAIARFKSMNLMEKLKHPTREYDPIYFIVYRYYISKQFTISQRMQIAMDHHHYESLFFNSEYIRQTYRSDGILLWEQSFDDLRFTIDMIATSDNRNEGELSVVLSVNNVKLSMMSFCYVNRNLFGLSSSMTLIISRNQTSRTSSRELFDQRFKQNTPQFFCLSAICGIAMTNEFSTIFGIKHEAQIIYKKSLDSGFRNSYTALWEKFEGVEIDQHVFMLSVPLSLRPVGLVSGGHRRRARARRHYWDQIVQSTCSSLARYRTLSSANTPSEKPSRTGPLSGAPPTEGYDRLISATAPPL
jgi:uncharacterized protein VirK/YbjX